MRKNKQKLYKQLEKFGLQDVVFRNTITLLTLFENIDPMHL